MMDFENLFSKPPNPALGKKSTTNSDQRIGGEIDDTEVEETQEEKIKWKVKLECEQMPKKFRHSRSSTSPKNLQHRKSRSKDYDAYTDDDICNQEPEDNFAKELQQYIQAKEMASVTQSLLCPEESVKKETAKGTKKAIKQKNINLKAVHKNGKKKKMKRKCPGPGDKGNASLRSSGSQDQNGKSKEQQQPVRMSQGFINQHTVQRQGKQICKYFLERKCIKGDQCKFDHDAEIEKKKEMSSRALLPWRKGGTELGGPGVRADTVPQPATGLARAERAGSAPRSDGRGFCYAILKPGVSKSFVDKIVEWLSFSLVHKLQ
ncbi:hypothetical protein E5288_WYG017391 [Bos mutus]|uniref:C3H1-type domain-containing protein n=1 Tax=Bos mutus TaxID=72004 RepID=A0A6B0RMH7_9CETA|nr:hypothetical protein [Bos mutus]